MRTKWFSVMTLLHGHYHVCLACIFRLKLMVTHLVKKLFEFYRTQTKVFVFVFSALPVRVCVLSASPVRVCVLSASPVRVLCSHYQHYQFVFVFSLSALPVRVCVLSITSYSLLSQWKPVHLFTRYFFKVRFNIVRLLSSESYADNIYSISLHNGVLYEVE